MRKLALVFAAFSLILGGTSFAGQQQQHQAGEGECPISSAELCYTDGNGVKTCTRQVVYGPCGAGGDGGGQGGDTGGGDTGGTPGGGTGSSGPNP